MNIQVLSAIILPALLLTGIIFPTHTDTSYQPTETQSETQSEPKPTPEPIDKSEVIGQHYQFTAVNQKTTSTPQSTKKSTSSQKSTQRTGWYLTIPEIGIDQKMTKITRIGNELPVPDEGIGYYQHSKKNILILGHDTTAFKNLSKTPKKITITTDDMTQEFTLMMKTIRNRKEINMSKIVNYTGVVLMTCAGEQDGDTKTHRLILYYAAI